MGQGIPDHRAASLHPHELRQNEEVIQLVKAATRHGGSRLWTSGSSGSERRQVGRKVARRLRALGTRCGDFEDPGTFSARLTLHIFFRTRREMGDGIRPKRVDASSHEIAAAGCRFRARTGTRSLWHDRPSDFRKARPALLEALPALLDPLGLPSGASGSHPGIRSHGLRLEGGVGHA